jgi:1-acyl-sn-glycerol-3-phosphate acyltransferase
MSASAIHMQRFFKTLYEYVALYGLLALFGLTCLGFSAGALLVYPLLPSRWGKTAGRLGIMSGFRFIAWTMTLTGIFKLDLSAIDSLRDGPPVILAPNHPTLIDAVLILTRHPNIACVMKAELVGNIFMGGGSCLARYIRSDLPRRLIKGAIADLRSGGVLLLFPEGTRTTRTPVNPLKASVGVIAKHAGVPVQVAIIETDSPYLSKGWPPFRIPKLPITYRVRLGRRFDPPADVPSFMAALEQEYARELTGLSQCKPLGEMSLPRAGNRT